MGPATAKAQGSSVVGFCFFGLLGSLFSWVVLLILGFFLVLASLFFFFLLFGVLVYTSSVLLISIYF